MKRFVFISALSASVSLLFFASHTQMQGFLTQMAASTVKTRVSKPARAARPTFPFFRKAALSWETIPALNSPAERPGETPAADVTEIKPELSFVEKAMNLIVLYRDGNQTFFNDQIAHAGAIFRRVLREAWRLDAKSSAEAAIREAFLDAARARLRSLRIFRQIIQSPQSPDIESWWEKNIALLRQANEAITQAVALTGKEILTDGRPAADDTAILLENLQEKAKGILVVSRPAT